MQHLLQVSRKVDYALRAMIYLAGQPVGTREPLQDVARKNEIPREFLAKILKSLGDAGLVSALRGPGGGVSIARPPASRLLSGRHRGGRRPHRAEPVPRRYEDLLTERYLCTMQSVWKSGQERMLDVYRTTMLSDLVGQAPMPLTLGTARAHAAAAHHD